MSITSKSAKEDTPVQDKLSSMDYWFAVAVLGDRRSELIENMYEALAEETPPILSVVGERTCNLSCAHCIFQDERSSREISNASRLEGAAKTIVSQMGENPIVVHEGRIFRPWHLSWLSAIREVRPNSHIGMIDNGTFLNHSAAILSSGFKFDWLDISLDGPETVHNFQRRSSQAFHVAIKGIENAREFITPGGRVTSLFTLTSINHASVLDMCRALPTEVDEWHITTLSPARPEISEFVVNDEEFAKWWVEQRLAFKKISVKVLKLELGGKGISRNVIDDILEEAPIDEEKMARELLEKRAYKWDNLDPKVAKQKKFQYLAGKGFSWDIIEKVVIKKRTPYNSVSNPNVCS